MPRIVDAFAEETVEPDIFREMGEQGLLGATVAPEFGGAGASYVSWADRARDRSRRQRLPLNDVRSIILVIHPINTFGSQEQKEKYLPKLTGGEWIGCFGLTEPDAGSDPAGMRTFAKKVDGGYCLNGSKTWISNAPVADVFVVWAKSDEHDGKIRGFILEKGMDGLTAPKSRGKCRCVRR